MSDFDPHINFAKLEEAHIAKLGLDAAEYAFMGDVEAGLTNGDSLAIVVGVVKDGEWRELGSRLIGSDAAQFVKNISATTGKLATALNYHMDSVDAYARFGSDIPEGPQRYVGGVIHIARVKTLERGWLKQVFAGAASGVQGHLDMATVYTALTRMGAAWGLKMQAEHGKGE